MRYFWLNKKNNKNLILFMNGWGMDESVVSHLNYEDFDILTLSDYRDFGFNFKEFDLSYYDKKCLIAWSMGVYVSNLFADIFDSFDKKIAIAGTNKIIDNKFGIPLKIYNCTTKLFNEESKNKFIKGIFQDEKPNIKIEKSTAELKDELISIQNLKTQNELSYNKAIIPTKDVIVPYQNQINYWNKTNAEIVEIRAPHYVFNNFKSWQDIIC